YSTIIIGKKTPVVRPLLRPQKINKIILIIYHTDRRQAVESDRGQVSSLVLRVEEMNLLSTSSINNVDIQAILNEINDDDEEFLLHHQDSMADISSLSIGGVTNSFHFAPAQISAAVNSAVVVEHQQRLPYSKGTRVTPIKGNKRREID
ncbi:MAG: hypothetical protein ACK53Y_25730, partial [bacterium]